MPDSIAINIAAIFMGAGCISLQKFYFKRMKFNTHWIPLSGGVLIAFGIATLFLSAGFTFFVGFENFLLGIALAFGLCLSFTNPIIALSFFLLNLLIRPWELLPDNSFLAIIPRALGVTSLVSWIFHRLRSGKLSIQWNMETTLLTLFVIWTCFSTLYNTNAASYSDEFAILFATFFPIVILSVLILNSVTDELDLGAVVSALIMGTTGAIAVAIYLTVNDPRAAEETVRLNSEGLLGNPNDLAAMIALVLPFLAFRLTKVGRANYSFAASVIGGLILLVGLFMSQSRGALLAILLGICVYFLISSKKLIKFVTLGLFLIPIPVALFFAIDRGADDLQGSTSSRWNYAVAGVRMAKSNPIFGVGMNSYPLQYEKYTPEFFEWGQRTAHSSWILALAETGLPGFFLFILLFVFVLNRTWKIRENHPAYFISMIMYGTTMSFLSHTFLIIPYISFFLCFSAWRTLKKGVLLVFVATLGSSSLSLPNESAAASTKRKVTEGISAVTGGQKPIAGSSPHFSNKLELSGSRGEVLNFQIKVDAKKCETFSVEGLPFEINFFQASVIKTEYPSFKGADVGEHFDPLIPLPDDKLCPERNPALVWGELIIPKGIAPKKYTGTIRLGQHKISAQVNVWKMEMSDEMAFPAYSELTSWYAVLGHFGKWDQSQAKITRMYFEQMLKHRIIPIKSWVAFPKVSMVSGKPNLNLKNEPTPDQSFYEVTLSKRPKWAMFDFPTIPPEKTDKPETKTYFQAMENANKSLGRPGKGFIYLWDEPKKEYFSTLQKLAKIAKTNAPSLKVMVTTPYNKKLEPYVDIFSPVMDQFDAKGFPGPEVYKSIQKKGKQVWWYISCLSHGCDYLSDSQRPDFVIDRSSAYIRSIPWISFRYGIDHFLYYAVVEGYKNFPKRDPWKSLWDFSGNGDGTLFYPGRPGMFHFKEHIPVPSIRLKLWREASFDYEYLKWISKTNPKWFKDALKKIASSTTQWSRSYVDYQNLRDKIGEYLNQQ